MDPYRAVSCINWWSISSYFTTFFHQQQQNNNRNQAQSGHPEEFRPWTECIPWQPGCPFVRSPGQGSGPQNDQEPASIPWNQCTPWRPGCPYVHSPGQSSGPQNDQSARPIAPNRQAAPPTNYQARPNQRQQGPGRYWQRNKRNC